MELTGAQILMECLLEQDVDTVFGYPGGTILNVYDALYGYEDKIHHILTAHEQGASHAADGGWLCQIDRQSRCLFCDFRTRGNEPYHRYCDGIYGFFTGRLHYL